MKTLALALVHYPVIDRAGETVTSAITNIDLHDLSRSAYSYGLKTLYVVHPIGAQRELAQRICDHWVHGAGGRRIPDRSAPLAMIQIVPELKEVGHDLPQPVEFWATSAREPPKSISHASARVNLEAGEGSVVILLGTAWGLSEGVLREVTHVLEPIHSTREDGYNHLSVRAAGAILLDRLLSPSRKGRG